MLKNKKLLFSFLLIVLIAVITACGGSDDNNGDNAADNGDNNATENNNANEEASADGQEVYKGNCLSCHGDEGKGGNGPELQGDDFAADYDNVVQQVKEGGSGMPAFEGQLSEDEIDAVAKYITEEIQ